MWFSRCLMLSCASLLLLVLLPSGTRAQSLTIRGGFTYSGLLRRLLGKSIIAPGTVYVHSNEEGALLSRYTGVLIPKGADISKLPKSLQDELLLLFNSEESTPQPNSELNAHRPDSFHVLDPQELSPLSSGAWLLPEAEFRELKTKVAEQEWLLRVFEKQVEVEEHHMLFVNEFAKYRQFRAFPVTTFEQLIFKLDERRLLEAQTFLQRYLSQTHVEFGKEKQKLERLQQELLTQEELRKSMQRHDP